MKLNSMPLVTEKFLIQVTAAEAKKEPKS